MSQAEGRASWGGGVLRPERTGVPECRGDVGDCERVTLVHLTVCAGGRVPAWVCAWRSGRWTDKMEPGPAGLLHRTTLYVSVPFSNCFKIKKMMRDVF